MKEVLQQAKPGDYIWCLIQEDFGNIHSYIPKKAKVCEILYTNRSIPHAMVELDDKKLQVWEYLIFETKKQAVKKCKELNIQNYERAILAKKKLNKIINNLKKWKKTDEEKYY